MSISQGNIGPPLGFGFPRAGPRDKAIDGGMSVRPFFGKARDTSIAYRAGLRPGHAIVAVDGESPNLHGCAFLVWFRLNRRAGDTVELTAIESAGTRKIRYELGSRPQ